MGLSDESIDQIVRMAEIARSNVNTRKSGKNIDFETDNFILKVGGKCFKLVAVSGSPSLEDQIREEYEKIYDEKIESEKRMIYDEIAMFKEFAIQTIKNYDEMTKELNKKYNSCALMPDIDFSMAKRGLSIYKGRDGNIVWLYITIYSPDTLLCRSSSIRKEIPTTIRKKISTPIIISIETRESSVLSITTKTLTLDSFNHYHKTGMYDCWGTFHYQDVIINTPEDVLNVALTASRVLGTINERSLGNTSPRGLPRFSSLKRKVLSYTAPTTSAQRNQNQNSREIAESALLNQTLGGWHT